MVLIVWLCVVWVVGCSGFVDSCRLGLWRWLRGGAVAMPEGWMLRPFGCVTCMSFWCILLWCVWDGYTVVWSVVFGCLCGWLGDVACGILKVVRYRLLQLNDWLYGG